MAIYKGNLGFVEFLKFQDTATDAEQTTMDAAVTAEDWAAYQALISQVLGINLK